MAQTIVMKMTETKLVAKMMEINAAPQIVTKMTKTDVTKKIETRCGTKTAFHLTEPQKNGKTA